MKFITGCIFLMLASCLQAMVRDADSVSTIKVRAERIKEPMTIDGLLAEAVWHNGNAVAAFKQRDPIEGSQPTEKTEVRVAFDDDAIYIGAQMYDSAPDSIIARLGRRDADINSDAFGVGIDSYFDRRSGFYFIVNAAGTLTDGVFYNDDWSDDSWDGIWHGVAKINDQGWSVEMRIPYSQLRFHKQEEYVWGINFLREITRKNEEDYLVYTPKNGSGFVSRFVELIGIKQISPPRRIELLPYLRAKAEYTHPDAEDPFIDGSRYLPGAGLDLKLGLGQNLTLDGTINPDFGQVEVDPAVVNLSDVETFYQEKRPFFIEGSSIFNFGQGGANNYWSFNWGTPDFFYSRRIGRTPQASLPDYDYANVPEGTRILGAAKLSGKLGKSWNIGTIHATTAREIADLEYGGKKFYTDVEPLTYYGLVRVQKEFQEGRRAFGLISTLTSRQFKEIRLRDELNSDAVTLGLDGWTFLDSSKTWVLTGWAGMSQVRGNTTRMIDLQRSSRHYFQRPDADYVQVDSAATAMTGYAARFYLNKQKGNVFFNSALGFISPKFDTNDMGFMWRTDIINGHIGGGYQWTKPNKFRRNMELGIAAFRSYDFGGNIIWEGLFHFGYLQLLNYYNFNWDFAYNPQTINNNRTRGGPLTLNPPGWQFEMMGESDDRKAWVFELGAYIYQARHTKTVQFSVEVGWKPAANVKLSLGPSLMNDYTYAQWIDVFDDPTATTTFGQHYVFGQLDLTELSASIRLDWAFTPKLSLQLYLQPLISAGDYRDFKELARPKSFDFTHYGEDDSRITLDNNDYTVYPFGLGNPYTFGFDNPDFNFKSLRGNAVLRWEFLPGSTLYFVWTQNRSDSEEIGNFQFNHSVTRLLDTRADNIFMVKLAYWRGL